MDRNSNEYKAIEHEHKLEFYKKLFDKLLLMDKCELSLEDYIMEVNSKIGFYTNQIKINRQNVEKEESEKRTSKGRA